MNKRRPLTIKWKLFLYLCLFAGVLLLLLWLLQIVFLESFYKAYKAREIQKAAETVEENMDNNQISSLLEELSTQQGIDSLVADPHTGKVLQCQTGQRPVFPMEPAKLQEYYEEAMEAGGIFLHRWEEEPERQSDYHPSAFLGAVPPRREKMESILCALALSTKDGDRLVVLTSVLSPVSSTLEALRAEFLFISLCLVCCSLALALLLSRKIARPIARLSQAARQLGQGKFDVTFQGGGYREVDQLSHTLTQAARQLGRQDDLRRELLANVSHDLRTPLTMIVGYAEVIRDLPGENTPENIQVIIDEAARLSDLVTDLLDLSKLQAQVQPMEKGVFCLTDSVRDTVERLRKMVGAAGYQVEFFHDGNAWVEADELRLSQVVYNLVGNAIAHTGEDKKVTVEQKIEQDQVCIRVTDTGEGIPPEERELIWERYYQKSKNGHRPQTGTGLGLAIARAVLQQHGAGYGVESQMGQGSIFWFSLPLVLPGQQ